MQPPEAAVRFPTLVAARDGDALQLLDRIAHIRLRYRTPELVVIDDFLSALECAALIAAAAPRLAASETVADDSDALARTSQGMFFDPGETALIRQIDARVAQAFQWPITHAEDLQVTCYQVDQRYEPHRDYFSHTTPEAISGVQQFGQRVATVLFYLNEPKSPCSALHLVFAMAGAKRLQPYPDWTLLDPGRLGRDPNVTNPTSLV